MFSKALLASRTNTLFSAPMLLGMLGSFHGTGGAGDLVAQNAATGTLSVGLIISLLLIAALELNAIFGKLSILTTVKGVIHSSIGLTIVFLLLLQFV